MVSHWHCNPNRHFYGFIACYVQHANPFRGACNRKSGEKKGTMRDKFICTRKCAFNKLELTNIYLSTTTHYGIYLPKAVWS